MSYEYLTSCHDQPKSDAKKYLDSLSDNTASHDAVIQRYEDSNNEYDEKMAVINYNGPKETALTLGKLFPNNRKNVSILDVAAGTGLCATEFRKLGFQKMDAFDASQQMLNEANTYNAVTICGMSVAIMRKLPAKALEELIRVVKPGGYVINTGSEATFDDNNVRTEDFRRSMKSLETQGKWKHMEVRHFLGYLNGKSGGVSVHQVC